MLLPLALTLPSGPMLPVLVFVAEVCVVTLSTMRTIFVARGMKFLAPLLGFFEISIWLFAIGQIMQNLNDVSCYLAFAGGFTLGNFFGISLEQKLALGSVVVKVITHQDAAELVRNLQDAGYGVTTVDAQGTRGPVQMVWSVIRRKELDSVVELVRQFDADAFYSVYDLQSAASQVAGAPKTQVRRLVFGPTRLLAR